VTDTHVEPTRVAAVRARLTLGLVVVGLLLGLAGCSAAGSVSMDPVESDADLARQASQPLPTGPDTGAREDRLVALRAVENGSATTVAGHPPVETDPVYRHAGTFYRLSVSRVGSEPARVVEYRLNLTATTDRDGGESTVVAFDQLPAVDRTTLAPVFDSDPLDRDRERVDLGETYRHEEFEASRLATGAVDAVEYRGDVVGVAVESRARDRLDVYRYEATTVARNATRYARALREQYAFEFSALSEAERAVVEEATGGAYYAESTDDDGFDRLVDRLREHDPVTGGDTRGTYLVRHDGRLYWTRAEFGSFVED
jgi:hypothetical protein